MLAIIYLALMFAVGDAIGRRFFPYLSLPHRLASAFLCGLLSTSWFTYFVGLIFASSPTPMFWANIVSFPAIIAVLYFLGRNAGGGDATTTLDTSETDFLRWDWALAGIFLLFSFWLMFRTFAMSDGSIQIGHHQFPDFGSTLSIMQSFAVGHNFPTEYPHFSGERIRYHFLFYFQAGNLEYLGLTPAWANNILSILSLSSLLTLIMTLGSLIFQSRVAGRIGAILFFFQGSLAFIPFLAANSSFRSVLDKLSKMTMYLNSGLPYRGEDWGVWSQNVFLNQRHFTSSIAIFLLVLIFLFIRYRETLEAESIADVSAEVSSNTNENAGFEFGPESDVDSESDEDAEKEGEDDPAESNEDSEEFDDDDAENKVNDEGDDDDEDVGDKAPAVNDPTPPSAFGPIAGYIFSGVLLGLLPLWNGPVYLSAAVVLAVCLVLFPKKKELIYLAVAAGIIALPQVVFLATGSLRPAGYSVFRWGFVIDNAGVFDVLYYIFFTFGFKWVFLAIAMYFASWMQRRLFAAILILFPLTFCFRFSEEVLANHKFLNVWLVVANIFVGFALVKLWNLRDRSSTIPTRIAAITLTILIVVGGAIDLVPIWNSYFITMKYVDDPLVEWAKTNTAPRSVFLSQKYINHQLLLAGRRLFYGDPYYAWSVGYDTPAREALAKRMFETRDVNELLALVRENNIDYIAIDDMIRNSRDFISRHNEDVVAKYFPLVFTDEKREYANIKIYKVPDDLRAMDTSSDALPAPPSATPVATPVEGTLFTASEGNQPGQLARPRGIAIDANGNIYVADTGNSRVQKFDPAGKFLLSIGEKGLASGQIEEPNGVAVDASNNIYVTDAKNHKLVRFKSDGQFDKEWAGPGTGTFYGPRDLEIGPNKLVYVIDQGGTRICKFDSAADSWTMWGSSGSGEGQFNEPTGITIGGGNVYVADANNNRVQVFDLDGQFLRQFEVVSWERSNTHYPDLVYDDAKKLLYVGNGRTNEILVFTPDGSVGPKIEGTPESILMNPSSMVLAGSKLLRKLIIANTGNSSISVISIDSGKPAK